MQLLRNVWSLASVILVLALFACTNLPTAVDPSPERSASDFFDRAPAPGFGALEWREPLDEDVVARGVIGPAGGVMQLWGTGVEIRFPEGAVSESVLIEARALQGSIVVFGFGAHGLTFGVPVQIRIASERLAGSWLEWGEEEIFDGDEMRRYLVGLLGVVYFEGDSTSEVTPLKTLPVYMDEGTVVLEITDGEGVVPETEHFFAIARYLGYAVASG